MNCRHFTRPVCDATAHPEAGFTVYCCLEPGHDGQHHNPHAKHFWDAEPPDYARQRPASLRAELEAERAKSAELAAALVDYQRQCVVMQQERDEARGEVLGLLRMLRERGVEL